MQPAAGAVEMLAQVKRIELGERGKTVALQGRGAAREVSMFMA
jgi:hypothetical protein